MKWTNEMKSQLREAWAGNLSASEIGAEFGCSRRSILGKAHALGLPGRGKRVTPAEKEHRRNKRRHAKASEHIAKFIRRPKFELDPVPPSPEIDNPFNLSIGHLTEFHCRWITNDDVANATYCGHAVVDGSSWCSHHLVVVNPPKRDLSNDALIKLRHRAREMGKRQVAKWRELLSEEEEA